MRYNWKKVCFPDLLIFDTYFFGKYRFLQNIVRIFPIATGNYELTARLKISCHAYQEERRNCCLFKLRRWMNRISIGQSRHSDKISFPGSCHFRRRRARITRRKRWKLTGRCKSGLERTVIADKLGVAVVAERYLAGDTHVGSRAPGRSEISNSYANGIYTRAYVGNCTSCATLNKRILCMLSLSLSLALACTVLRSVPLSTLYLAAVSLICPFKQKAICYPAD